MGWPHACDGPFGADLWDLTVASTMRGVSEPAPTGTSYDILPYPGSAVTTTHPAQLCALATLFGMSPAPAERCRALELGCGDGANLVPMAYGLPESDFVGIDLSSRQVEMATSVAREIGLNNVRFEARDIRDLASIDGPFDYIICHGVFSWVPDDVREAILAGCRDLLSPNGMAFISYNALPGWHMRGIIRDMMVYHARHFADPEERATQAKAIIQFMDEASGKIAEASGAPSPFHDFIASEKKALDSRPDYYIVHEFLEAENRAFYLHEFAALVRKYGLQYLADASFSAMLTTNLPAEVGQTIDSISADHLALEQYRDFATNRMFRQSLICRDDVIVTRELNVANLARLFFRLGAPPGPRPWPDDAAPLPGGGSLALAAPVAKAVVAALREAFPAALSHDELRTACRNAGHDEAGDEYFGGVLFTLLAHDAIDIRSSRPALVTVPGDRPRASAVARAMAPRGQSLPNLMHYAVSFDGFTDAFIPFVDGTRDRAALAAVVRELLAHPEMTLQTATGPVKAANLEAPDIDGIVDQLLQGLASFGLLEA